jgi:hypothetical protein
MSEVWFVLDVPPSKWPKSGALSIWVLTWLPALTLRSQDRSCSKGRISAPPAMVGRTRERSRAATGRGASFDIRALVSFLM